MSAHKGLKIGLICLVVLVLITGFHSRGRAQTIQIFNNDPMQQPCTTVLMQGYFNVHVVTNRPQPGDTVRVRVESDIDSGFEILLKSVNPQGPVEWHYHTVDSPVRVWDPAVPLPPRFFCKNYVRGMPGTGWVRATAVDLGIFAEATILDNLNPTPVFNSLGVFNGVTSGNMVNISPDNDGDTDFLNVNYKSSDTGPSWVVIDTNRNGVFEITEDWAMPVDWTLPIWAEGDREISIFWEGRDQKTGQVLPNGTYNILIYIESWSTGQYFVDTMTLKVMLKTNGCSGVVMSGARPVSDAKVWFGNPSSFGWAKTDIAGNYAIFGLKPGLYHGHAEAEKYTIADSQGILIGQGMNIDINFELGGPGSINLNVFLNPANGTGDTLYGKVEVWSPDNPYGTGVKMNFATGEDYKNCIIPLAPGQYMLKASVPRYAPKVLGPVTVVTLETADCTFVLEKTGSITGKVALPEPNTTGNTLYVGINAKGLCQDNWGFGGAQIPPGQSLGTFVIYDLLPDTYTLQAQCNGYPDAFLQNIRVDTGAPAVRINFAAGSRITGRVFLKKGGLGVANPWIKIEAYSPAINRGRVIKIVCNTGTLDETINYEIRGLEPGRYSILYSLEGFELPLLTRDLGPETNYLDVVLERAKGVIAGRVSGLKSPLDYPAVQVLFSRAGESVFRSVPVDTGVGGNTGAYRIMNLSTGQYSLIANKWIVPGFPTGEYPSLIKQVFVTSGDTVTNVDFNLMIDTPGTIVGTVNYSGSKGYDLTGKMVYAVPAGAVVYGAQTRWQCPIQTTTYYIIPGLMPGAYKVMVETNLDTSNDRYGMIVPDAVCTPKLVNVTGGDTAVVNFTLTDGYKIKGNVILPGPLSYEFHCGVDAHIKGPHPEENHTDVVIPPGQLSGSYEISSLVPGDYVITAHSPDFIHAVREIKIVDNDVNNINFYLSKGASIKGKIIDADNGAVLPLVDWKHKEYGMNQRACRSPSLERRRMERGGYGLGRGREYCAV